MTRRYYRIRPLERVEQRLVDGVPFVLADYEHDGVRHHVAATLGDPRRPAARAARARAPTRARCRRASRCSPTSTRASPTPATSSALLAEADLPAAVARVAFVLAPAETAHGRRASTFGRGAGRRARRGPRPARPAPDDGRADGAAGGCRTSSSSGCPSAPDVYLFRAVARENQRDERLVALAEVRDLTPVRDDDGRITALPELERIVAPGVRGDALGAVAPARRASGCCGTGCVLYVWPTIDFGPEEAGAVDRALRARDRRARARAGDAARAHARGRRRARPRAAHLQPGRPRRRRRARPTRRREPLQPLDEGAQRIVSARRRGTLHPAEIVKLLAPQRPQPGAAIPAGEFVEHDLDDETASWSRSTARRPPTRASVVVGLIRNRTERYPEGMLRVVAARRPDALARLARRARVPADHRRARPRRAARRAGRVVRALLGREDRDGLRHREHGLGRGGAAADRRASRRRAARSTSSSAASTSARSRTSTPRRRC